MRTTRSGGTGAVAARTADATGAAQIHRVEGTGLWPPHRPAGAAAGRVDGATGVTVDLVDGTVAARGSDFDGDAAPSSATGAGGPPTPDRTPATTRTGGGFAGGRGRRNRPPARRATSRGPEHPVERARTCIPWGGMVFLELSPTAPPGPAARKGHRG